MAFSKHEAKVSTGNWAEEEDLWRGSAGGPWLQQDLGLKTAHKLRPAHAPDSRAKGHHPVYSIQRSLIYPEQMLKSVHANCPHCFSLKSQPPSSVCGAQFTYFHHSGAHRTKSLPRLST